MQSIGPVVRWDNIPGQNTDQSAVSRLAGKEQFRSPIQRKDPSALQGTYMGKNTTVGKNSPGTGLRVGKEDILLAGRLYHSVTHYGDTVCKAEYFITVV